MSKQPVNIGSFANDGTGDTLRNAGTKINANFTELYTAMGDGTTLASGVFVSTLNTVTLFNKTLNQPTISTILNSGPLVLPTGPNTLATLNGIETFTNKTLTSPTISQILTNSGSSTITLPATTDTLVGKATTDTFTNKTFDTAGTGNVFKINGTTITANTGTGSNVLATSPTLTTPIFSSIVNTGTLTLPTSTDTLVGKATTDTFTNKTFDTAGAGNVFKINGTTLIDKTGTGKVVLDTSPTITTPSIAQIINTGTLTLPTSTDTLVGKATTDTFTNKTLSGATNFLDVTSSSNKIRFNYTNTGSLPNAITYQGAIGVITGAAKLFFADSGSWIEIGSNNSSIDLFTDVDLSTAPPTNKQTLSWVGTNAKFIPATLGAMTSYTGNGSQTVFAINANYNVYNILVFVNGVCKVPLTEYTLSGSNLTFIVAPINGAVIMIRYLG
jgi:hypothetical protein